MGWGLNWRLGKNEMRVIVKCISREGRGDEYAEAAEINAKSCGIIRRDAECPSGRT